jgi:hypothetical protein
VSETFITFEVNLKTRDMEHNYVRNENFNILTIKCVKGDNYFVTGETKDGISIGDTIDYIINERFDLLEVTDIKERRDSRSFPKGNNLHYECDCKVVPNPNPPNKK